MTSFDLHLATLERRGSVVARLEYNADIFDAPTVRKMLGHFRSIVKAVVGDASTALAGLPLLTDAELQTISAANTKALVDEYPKDRLLHELPEEHLRRDPVRLAAVSSNRRLSYAELDTQASRLAERLRSFGVRPGTVAGICCPSSPDLLIALLAVLRTGAAYAWLGPDTSSADFTEKISACGARLAIMPKRLRNAALPEGIGAVYLDGTGQDRAAAGANPADPAVPVEIGCIEFSAGSRGPAKAALITHSALAARAATAAAIAGLVAEDRVALQTSNASFEMLLGCMLRGATAVFVPPLVLDSPAEYPRFVEKQKCSVLLMPTPLWRRLVFSAANAREVFFDGVRLAIIYGARPSSATISA
ncbi:MAG: AMP-binding protein, partial [Bryobacteraceae bacterium]